MGRDHRPKYTAEREGDVDTCQEKFSVTQTGGGGREREREREGGGGGQQLLRVKMEIKENSQGESHI